MAEAWVLYDRIRSDYRVFFAAEPAGVESHWRQLTQATRPSTHVWNDAYLAAFAMAMEYEIVTFDRDFEQFTLANYTLLA